MKGLVGGREREVELVVEREGLDGECVACCDPAKAFGQR